MQSIDSFISTLGFPTAFEMIFGLIISMILFLIDRSEKKRQEETLRRQDESLDIILDQVSKVNVFQTKTLSLAIESLGKDFEIFRKDFEDIKKNISLDNNNLNGINDNLNPDDVIESNQAPQRSAITSLSTNFGNLLSNQLNSFIEQMKSNLSEITESKIDSQKNIYKVKKGLEFDIKDLFNMQNMLNELKPTIDSEISKSVPVTSKSNKSSDEEVSTVELDGIHSTFGEKKLKKKTKTIDLENIAEQIDKLESIPELVKFTESIMKNFENPEFFQTNSDTIMNIKKEKKKVKPDKVVSKQQLENQDK